MCMKSIPANELTSALQPVAPGRALDLACGAGRHSIWLTERGWEVTSVDREHASGAPELRVPGLGVPGLLIADLEKHEFAIEPAHWDLIVCWLYWQPDLLPAIQAGGRPGGLVALAGKTSGRFATSLSAYRAAFPGFEEISAGEDASRAFFIARRS